MAASAQCPRQATSMHCGHLTTVASLNISCVYLDIFIKVFVTVVVPSSLYPGWLQSQKAVVVQKSWKLWQISSRLAIVSCHLCEILHFSDDCYICLYAISICHHLQVAVALPVARRIIDWEVAGSRPTKVVCGRPPLLLPSCRKLEFRLSALMDSDLACVNGKSGR